MKKEIKELIRVANELSSRGLRKEFDALSRIVEASAIHFAEHDYDYKMQDEIVNLLVEQAFVEAQRTATENRKKLMDRRSPIGEERQRLDLIIDALRGDVETLISEFALEIVDYVTQEDNVHPPFHDEDESLRPLTEEE